MRRVLVLLLLLASAANAQTLDTKAIDRIVTDTLRAWQVPGAAIAIVRDDRVILTKGYGTKDLGGSGAVTPDTLFQIASTSKAFTTTAMAVLADEKKLSWDDPVRQHVDYFRLSDPCADAMVTLRDLVTHRIGARRSDELWDNTPITREEIVRRASHVDVSRFRHGYGYNNIMYIAAGEVVGRAAGVPWDDFLRTRLFLPLGMTRTHTTDAEWNANEHANGYRWDAKAQRMVVQAPIETATIGAGGGIKSTARDMAQWLRFQLGDGTFEGKRILSSDALAETKKPVVAVPLTQELHPESNVMAYALGWVVQDYRGALLVSHTGSLNGFRTQVALLPKQRAGVAVMINAGRGYAAAAIRNAVLDLLLASPTRDWSGYLLEQDRKADEKARKARQEKEAKRVRDTRPAHPLADYAGTYESRSHGKATVSVSGDGLVLAWERHRVPLAHWHYEMFNVFSEADDIDEDVTFATGTDGKVNTLTIFGSEFRRSEAPSGR